MGSLLLAINLTGQINMAKLDEGRAKNWRVQTSRVNAVTVQTLGMHAFSRILILPRRVKKILPFRQPFLSQISLI